MYDLYEALVKGKPNEMTARSASYFSECLIVDLSMFDWTLDGEKVFTNADGESFDAVWMEKYLNCSGSIVADVRSDNVKIAPMPSRTGNLDQYGEGTDIIGITRNGEQIEGKNGSSVVICYHQSSRWADLDLIYYPDVLARVDDAINACLKWSKTAPLLGAPDSMTQTQIAGILDDLMNGIPKCVVDGNLLEKLRSAGVSPNGVYSVEMTRPERVALVQYLSELHDVLMRRYYTTRGLDSHKTSKHAQVNESEATGQEVISWIIPLDRLKCRKKFCEEMQALGVNMSVDFAEPWNTLYDSFMKKLEEPEEMEGSEEDAAEDTADEDDSGQSGESGSRSEDQ